MTTGGGQCLGFPDTCKTPSPGGPVPIPYPNITMCSDGKGSSKVTILNKETLRKGDTFRMSSGDEGGTAGGSVISNKIKGKSEVKEGCDTVKVQGKAIAYLLVTIGQNGGCATSSPKGKHATPGQTKGVLKKVKGILRRVKVKVRKYLRDRKGKTKKTHVPPTKAVKNAADKLGKATTSQAKRVASEAMGDAGAKAAMRLAAKAYGGLVEMVAFAGKNVVDLIGFTATGVVIVIEAKGGASPLGAAKVAGVGYCLQGTPQYLAHIANMMVASPNPKVSAMGLRLQAALRAKKVKYGEARTRSAKGTTLRWFDP